MIAVTKDQDGITVIVRGKHVEGLLDLCEAMLPQLTGDEEGRIRVVYELVHGIRELVYMTPVGSEAVNKG